MKIWTYNLGQWIPDSYDLKDWKDEKEFSEWIENCGFSQPYALNWGEEYIEHIMFYPKKEDDKEWLADIPTTNSSFYFFIPNHPSFLIFKKEYGHLFNINQNDFVCVEHDKFINRKCITQIKKHYYKDKQTVTLNIKNTNDDIRIIKEFTPDKKDGESIYHEDATSWILKNFLCE